MIRALIGRLRRRRRVESHTMATLAMALQAAGFTGRVWERPNVRPRFYLATVPASNGELLIPRNVSAWIELQGGRPALRVKLAAPPLGKTTAADVRRALRAAGIV